MANKLVARVVRASVSAATSGSRGRRVSGPGKYDMVFFVVGEMHSGTCWLRRTLSAHPEIACGYEGSFFGRDYNREEISVYTGWISSFIRALAISEEYKVWHELPWNQWTDGYEEDLRNLTRNVAVSAMYHWWRLAKDREGGVFELTPEELEIRDAYLKDRVGFLASGRSMFVEERLGQLACRWSCRVGKARRDGTTLFGEGYLEIRYEDLLRDTPDTLRRVFGLLNARRDEGVIERCIWADSFERVSNRQRGEEDSRSFFRKGVAGDWRGVFTERDREIYEELAGDQLIEIGYE